VTIGTPTVVGVVGVGIGVPIATSRHAVCPSCR